MPPAARNLFEKRFLDFQKLFIGMVSIIVFSLCSFGAKILIAFSRIF
jgi:hypothetical protein